MKHTRHLAHPSGLENFFVIKSGHLTAPQPLWQTCISLMQPSGVNPRRRRDGGTPDARYCYQCKDATAHPMSKGMRELVCLFTDTATPRIAFETFFNAVGSVQGRLSAPSQARSGTYEVTCM
ncbi:hypothetical protein CHELA1G11_30058 [Hyphomicrobiales bacterium]|nr:hypothetical protein CHELA1G11_30058 [Hyphomicrobiales bacterium]